MIFVWWTELNPKAQFKYREQAKHGTVGGRFYSHGNGVIRAIYLSRGTCGNKCLRGLVKGKGVSGLFSPCSPLSLPTPTHDTWGVWFSVPLSVMNLGPFFSCQSRYFPKAECWKIYVCSEMDRNSATVRQGAEEWSSVAEKMGKGNGNCPSND